jgi:hypothetical protein
MEDLKQIQEFFSKPLGEGTLTPDELAYYRDNAMEKLANVDIVDKKLGKTRQGDKYIMVMYKEKWDFDNPPKKGMYNPETQWVKVFYNDESEIQDLMTLNENVHVEAFELGKALKGMGYDVKVKAVDDFGTNVFEIYFNNPADADDSIYYDVEKLGYDNVRVFANPQESVKENSRFEKRLAKMAADEKEKRAKSPSYAAASKLDVDVEDFFEKGQSYQEFKKRLDKLKEATKEEETEFHAKLDKLVHDTFGKRKGEMEEYNTGIYYDPAKERNAVKAKEASKSGIEKVKDMIQKIIKEEEGYSQYLKDDPEHPDGKTKGLDTRTMNKILMRVIQDLDELKQLGEGMIEEELCAKGKAYIEKRKAAGEKSSAYLSGRAVKVCKGQMKG